MLGCFVLCGFILFVFIYSLLLGEDLCTGSLNTCFILGNDQMALVKSSETADAPSILFILVFSISLFLEFPGAG